MKQAIEFSAANLPVDRTRRSTGTPQVTQMRQCEMSTGDMVLHLLDIFFIEIFTQKNQNQVDTSKVSKPRIKTLQL